MAEDDKIRYSDIIQPDDSIEKLVKQLGELNRQYETMVNAIRAGADRIVHSLKSASGATSEGRKSIDDATSATSRLERAQKELKLAISDTGKQIAWLKAQTSDANRTTVEQQRYLQQAISSYDRLKSELKQTVSLYKSLTAAERADSQMGQQLLNDIINLKNQIKALDDQMKPHIQTLTEVEKAEQKLAYLQSEEGQRLLELKAKIAEVTSARRQQKATTDPLVQAQEKLTYAQSTENEQLKLYSTQIKEANRVAQLRVQIANSAEGSYNRLSAQYELNKIKLNQMSGAEREAADVGKKLEAETNALYRQMIKLQEATGNYRLSVGHYQRTWDGLGISISNVVRELPAATVSMNTFFLGISNNIPMVVDEINRLKAKNKQLAAEGKETINVTRSIVKSLFSWNTILVVLLTALSLFGDEIGAWIKNLINARKGVISLGDALENINEELKSTNASYGENVVKLKQLQREWQKLETTADKTKWIEDNKSKFDDLGISITGVVDAELAFVNNTEAVLTAFKLRAKAAAAKKLAEDTYREAFIKQQEAEQERLAGPSVWDKFIFGLSRAAVTAEKNQEDRIHMLETEAKKAEATGDAYFDLADGFDEAAKRILKSLGLFGGGEDGPSTPGQRDLTDTIYRMALATQKKYEQSITELERDEYARRRKEAVDAAGAKIRALEETYRKNEEYLNDEEDKYKELTHEEVALIKKAQAQIVETILNEQAQLAYELEQIEKNRQIAELKLVEDTIKLRLQAVKEGTEEELQLKLKAIEIARQIALLENSLLPPSQRQSEATISAGFESQANRTLGGSEMTAFDQQQALEEARFSAVQHSEKQVTRFKLEQEKARWEKQIQLAEAGGLDWTQAQIDAAKATVDGIDRELKNVKGFRGFLASWGKNGLGGSILETMGFDEDALSAFDSAVSTVVGYLQEITDAEVELAEKAVEAAEERVSAAQSAYDAEIEARNNGYANNVATAKKELEQEKKKQQEKQKLLEQAQKRQEALNTIMQASSLITASANLWSSFSSVPIVGPILAAAAIATMWTSFGVAKIKARQVTAGSEEYGEGGLEFLEGGSHASGNDIDLGTSNKKGKRMRAEGGEALAIINKKRTRKYRKILPDVIDSFNRGTFEDKYLNAFGGPGGLNISFNSNSTMDLSKIEHDVRNIRKQNETKYYTMPDGTVVIQRKNVKRIIKN